MSATSSVASGSRDRRRAVEARLALVPRGTRTPPPEGRLGADDYAMPRLVEALTDLGPVFASFGRYLGARLDLLSKRDRALLSLIPQHALPMSERALYTCIAAHFGEPYDRRFFSFDPNARLSTIWMQRHDAWLAPGVPTVVQVVRPEAAAWLAADLPQLPLIGSCLEIDPVRLQEAIDDFASTLNRRLDQTHQATALATLAADASAHGGFDAPVVYRDHTAAGILTIERPAGTLLRDILADASGPAPSMDDARGFALRITSAWLRQALRGRTVPFDFDDTDIVVAGERLFLIGGAFESHSTTDRTRLLSYLTAVAADDPDAAIAWIVDAAASEGLERREEELRRRLRQAVPFRDGEWSGDDRFAEHVLVQWRMATAAGWPLTPHHLHVYRGMHAATSLAGRLAPQDDVLAGALRDERLNIGLAEARQLIDPRAAGAMLDRLLQDMIHLPQKLDDVLTLAAEGRLRVKLNVPDDDAVQHTRNRTVLLVATLAALAGVAAIARQVAPAFGGGAERLAAVVVLLLGGWLLVAAARL
jgi:predicted unusual protein kinase regulating ubiquinone biosynthesis (AarF/ABC1/UbiB family)